MPGTNLLVLFGLVFYLGASLLLWNLLLKEPSRLTPRSARTTRSPRWPIPLAKAVATALGGAATGGVSLLLIAIAVNAGQPGTMSAPVKWGVWTVATVLAILLIGRAPLIRRVVARTCLTVASRACCSLWPPSCPRPAVAAVAGHAPRAWAPGPCTRVTARRAAEPSR